MSQTAAKNATMSYGSAVTDEDIATFKRDGFILKKAMYMPEEIGYLHDISKGEQCVPLTDRRPTHAGDSARPRCRGSRAGERLVFPLCGGGLFTAPAARPPAPPA